MITNILFVFISIIVYSVSVFCAEKPVVDTSHGKISGKYLTTLYENIEYAAFMGIPYALPPIKDLRFLVS